MNESPGEYFEEDGSVKREPVAVKVEEDDTVKNEEDNTGRQKYNYRPCWQQGPWIPVSFVATGKSGVV